MQKDNRVQILVADDEEILRRNVCRALHSVPHFAVAGEAATGREAVRFVEEYESVVDIVLMDIEMETGNDGLTAAAKIHEISPETAVIMLTVHEDESTVFESYLIESVRDFVVKSYNNDEVLATIQRVYQELLRSKSANQKLRAEFQRLKNNEHSLLLAINLLSQLTPTEKEIIRLKLLGLSTRKIAASRMVEESTIKSQINSMLKKLGYSKSSQVTDLIRELKLEDIFTDTGIR